VKEKLPNAWYGSASWLRLLYPLSLLYGLLAQGNRDAYARGHKPVYRSAVPVIVIGNITVGGTGKTPLTLAVAKYLQAQGNRPAIISRGYKGQSSRYPLHVTGTTPVAACGDEALLLAMNTDVPVVVDPDRSRGVQFLENRFKPDVIVCDDGLQHYALARDIEIIVVDGERGFGNGMLLPAGPLREKPERFAEADFIVVNGPHLHKGLPLKDGDYFPMSVSAESLVNLRTHKTANFSASAFFNDTPAHANRVHAVAGIGNPARFFNLLQSAGFVIMAHAFPDHYRFKTADIDFADGLPVIMTEKDAVKCGDFATETHWYLKIGAQLPVEFWKTLSAKLETIRSLRACS
jgi:tetraacyldisaccharide 4'-kinase